MINKNGTFRQLIRHLPKYIWAAYHFRDYKPQAVSFLTLGRWLSQFEDKDHKAILDLLAKVVYISEKQTESLIVTLNDRLLERLRNNGIGRRNTIYVQLHDPGSSSPLMLNMLRDRARLEGRGYNFIDSKNVRDLHALTTKLGQGAIIYVDDFSASGHQFCTVRDHLAQYIVGTFSEFFLLPAICEEALYELGKREVEAIAGRLHAKADRPLHPHSSIFDNKTKQRLVDLSRTIDNKGGLGYGDLATMIIFYRNTPNTVPVILRGCMKQNPWKGILPRTTDLP